MTTLIPLEDLPFSLIDIPSPYHILEVGNGRTIKKSTAPLIKTIPESTPHLCNSYVSVLLWKAGNDEWIDISTTNKHPVRIKKSQKPKHYRTVCRYSVVDLQTNTIITIQSQAGLSRLGKPRAGFTPFSYKKYIVPGYNTRYVTVDRYEEMIAGTKGMPTQHPAKLKRSTRGSRRIKKKTINPRIDTLVDSSTHE